VQWPAIRQLAFVKAEACNAKFRGSQQSVAGEKLLQMMNRRIIQPGEGQMRLKFLPFPGNTDFRKLVFDAATKTHQVVLWLHTGPEHTGNTPRREGADSL